PTVHTATLCELIRRDRSKALSIDSPVPDCKAQYHPPHRYESQQAAPESPCPHQTVAPSLSRSNNSSCTRPQTPTHLPHSRCDKNAHRNVVVHRTNSPAASPKRRGS